MNWWQGTPLAACQDAAGVGPNLLQGGAHGGGRDLLEARRAVALELDLDFLV